MTSEPVYAKAEAVQALTGVSRHMLRSLADRGEIRAVRLAVDGEAQQQTPTLYRLRDVLEWLDSLPGTRT